MKNKGRAAVRWIWMFVVPVGFALVLGYVYLRSENRALLLQRAAQKAQNDALHGEIYQLRQRIEQHEAISKFLLSPDYERFIASGNDTSFCRLYFRASDSAWYAEVSDAERLATTNQFRLYMVQAGGDTTYVGHFENIADILGLQKIGKSEKGLKAIVTAAQRDEDPNAKREQFFYKLDF